MNVFHGVCEILIFNQCLWWCGHYRSSPAAPESGNQLLNSAAFPFISATERRWKRCWMAVCSAHDFAIFLSCATERALPRMVAAPWTSAAWRGLITVTSRAVSLTPVQWGMKTGCCLLFWSGATFFCGPVLSSGERCLLEWQHYYCLGLKHLQRSV